MPRTEHREEQRDQLAALAALDRAVDDRLDDQRDRGARGHADRNAAMNMTVICRARVWRTSAATTGRRNASGGPPLPPGSGHGRAEFPCRRPYSDVHRGAPPVLSGRVPPLGEHIRPIGVSGRRTSPCPGRRRRTTSSRSSGPRSRTAPRTAAARSRDRCRGRPRARGRSPPSRPAARSAGPVANCEAHRTAASYTSSAGTTSSTRPIRERLLGVHEAAGEAHVLRPRRADQPRQPLRATRTGDDAEQDLGLTELGVVGGDPPVGAQRQLTAAAQGVAGDRRDDRLRDRRHRGERRRQTGRPL